MSDLTLTILYDNLENPNNPRLMRGWGFSAFIELGERKILFDTGWSHLILLNNVDELNVPLESIDTIVISHQHWDHAGGLPGILERVNPSYLALPDGYSVNQTHELKRFLRDTEIIKSREPLFLSTTPRKIALSGSLKTSIGLREQGLVIEISPEASLLIVGCSHPGLEAYFQSLEQLDIAPIQYILGGLHGFKNVPFLKGKKIEKIFVGHCTQHKSLFHSAFGEKAISFTVGDVFSF